MRRLRGISDIPGHLMMPKEDSKVVVSLGLEIRGTRDGHERESIEDLGVWKSRRIG